MLALQAPVVLGTQCTGFCLLGKYATNWPASNYSERVSVGSQGWIQFLDGECLAHGKAASQAFPTLLSDQGCMVDALLFPILLSTHLPGIVLLLCPHRDDHHLERGQPQGPVGRKWGRKLFIRLWPLGLGIAVGRSEKEIHRIRGMNSLNTLVSGDSPSPPTAFCQHSQEPLHRPQHCPMNKDWTLGGPRRPEEKGRANGESANAGQPKSPSRHQEASLMGWGVRSGQGRRG